MSFYFTLFVILFVVLFVILCETVAPMSNKRGRKRVLSNMVYESFLPPAQRSSLLSVPAGAAVYENAISNRFSAEGACFFCVVFK